MARNVLGAATFPAGVAIGVGVGGAVGAALEPKLQSLKNESWQHFPTLPPQYALLAEGVASGHIEPAWAAARAAEQGVDGEAFGHVVDAMRAGPGSALAFELWRRGLIDDAGFGRAIKRESVEDEWIGPLRALKQRLLSPEELANARQQEFVDDGRLHSEGALQGYDAERMDLLFKMAGLPPGPMDGLTMLRRGIISEQTYRELVAEGHTKTKYTDDLLGLRQHILSAHEWSELWIRGWATEAQAKAGGALDGYDAAAMDRLYQNRGRPATVHQAHIGYARGGRLPGATTEAETIRRSVQESNIRTEWFDILYAQRYTMPSAFVLRALTEDGTFTEAQAENILLESGWRPDLAKDAATKWSGGGAAAPAMKTVAKAQARLFTTAHNEYMVGHIDEAQARSLLTASGATAAELDHVIRIWDEEQAILSRELSQAQILKLFKKALWTRDQALAALEYHGLTTSDANDLLDAV